LHGKSKITKTEKGKTGEEQCQEHAKFSLTSRGLLIKNSSWQTKHSIPHTTVTFYGDCMNMCEDFAPNFGDKKTGCCIMTMHCHTLLFSPGIFDQNQHDCRSPLTILFCFPTEDKTERLRF
jgi:hypothetical protein